MTGHWHVGEIGLCIHCGAHPSYCGPCPRPDPNAKPAPVSEPAASGEELSVYAALRSIRYNATHGSQNRPVHERLRLIEQEANRAIEAIEARRLTTTGQTDFDFDFNLIANMLDGVLNGNQRYTSAAVAEQVRLLREADNRHEARTVRLPYCPRCDNNREVLADPSDESNAALTPCPDCARNPGLCDEHDNAGVPLHPGPTKTFEIWSEGFAATGERGTAVLHATLGANSFKEACDLHAALNREFERYYDPKSMTYWGCRLFDNERDARKSFG